MIEKEVKPNHFSFSIQEPNEMFLLTEVFVLNIFFVGVFAESENIRAQYNNVCIFFVVQERNINNKEVFTRRRKQQ